MESRYNKTEADDRYGRIKTVAKSALAVGAGAAFLYRSGGGALLNEGAGRMSRGLTAASSKLSSKTLAGSFGNGKQLLRESGDAFKKAFNEYDTSIRLRPTKTNTLTSAIAEHARHSSRGKMVNNRMFNAELQAKLKKELRSSDVMQGVSVKRIDNIVDNAFTHITRTVNSTSQDATVYDFSKKFMEEYVPKKYFNADQQDFVKQRIAENLKIKKDQVFDYAQQNERINQQIVDKMLSDKKGLEKTFGTERNIDKKERIARRMLGDKAVTVNEMIDAVTDKETGLLDTSKFKDFKLASKDDDPMTFLQRLKELRDADETGAFGDLFVDRTIRKNNDGNIYSVSNITGMIDKAENAFLHTLPGKLIKPLDFHVYQKQIPHVNIFGVGSTDYLIPSRAEGNNGTVLDNTYARIYDKTYRTGPNGLEHIESLDDTYLLSGKYGMAPRLYKYMMGDVDTRATNNPLGFGQNPKMSRAELAKFKKETANNPNYIPNVLERIKQGSKDLSVYGGEAYDSDLGEYFADVRRLDDYFNKTTKAPDRKTLSRISDSAGDSPLKSIIDDYLSLTDEDLLDVISNDPEFKAKKFVNKDLGKLLDLETRNKTLISSQTSDWIMNKNYAEGLEYTDLVRRELFKEGLIQHASSRSQNLNANSLVHLIDNASISSTARDEVKSLAHWAVMQNTTELYTSDIEVKQVDNLKRLYEHTKRLFSGAEAGGSVQDDVYFLQDFADNAGRIAERRSKDTVLSSAEYLADIEKGHRPNDYIHVAKAVTGMDVIRDLNDSTKAWETSRKFVSQFFAGRNNPEDITTATFFPYFAAFRLTDALSEMKMSLGPEDTGSVLDITKNIAMKYVLPAAGAMTALSYLDYEMENFTGTSLKGTFANGVANVDLGFRKFADMTGLTSKLQDFYVNPIAQHYFEGPFMSYEERKDHYENGYESVRKGRFWGLGSPSEWMGGKIEYYQPNYVKRLNTNWRDIGLYGSSEEKWAHSWVPTLRHPLAPLNRLLNPYWLEEKNQYSRPYPVSSPLFAQGMPFSGLLNSTVGELIKPQRMMHTNRLTKDFIDVKDLIAMQNNRIKAREQGGMSEFTLLGSNAFIERGLNRQDFTSILPAGSPMLSTMALNTGGNFNSQEGTYSGPALSSIVEPTYRFEEPEDTNWLESAIMKISRPTNVNVMSQLEKMNQATKTYMPGNTQTGIIQRAEQGSARTHIDLLRDSEIATSIRNTSSLKQNLEDTAYSTKQLLGIYGFAADEILPGKKRYALANAGSMSGFSNSFWDESFGAAGPLPFGVGGFGQFMEIARRFFPHENRNIEYINPLRNNMPSWMPSRFLHGDPYTKVKKGDMRLPGAGYEALHGINVEPNLDLHPLMIGASKEEMYDYFLNKSSRDEMLNQLPGSDINVSQSDIDRTLKNLDKTRERIYKELDKGILNRGEFYDDFTKFKILADVAPWSQEYKDVRDRIKFGIDPARQKEFDATLKRVENQSKTHRFYDYNFIGTDFAREKVYIDQVTDNGFTVVGSDRQYRLAGIDVKQDNLMQKIQAGMEVTIEYDKSSKEDPFVDVVVMNGGSNINRELWKEKLGEAQFDGTVMSTRALSTYSQRILGIGAEALSHTQIPFLHNKFLKIETALENYNNEQVYGTSYMSWSRPIDSILKPMFNKSLAVDPMQAAIGLGTFVAAEVLSSKESVSAGVKTASQVASAIMTPGAFLGGAIGYGVNLGPQLMHTGAVIGTAAWATSYAYTHATNPILTSAIGAGVGALAGGWYDGSSGKGAAIGTAVGLALTAVKTDGFNHDKLFKKWIPESTEKRWELEEYFDRLTYIKYKGLFEAASRKALDEEGTDIARIIRRMEKDEEKREEVMEKALKNKASLMGSGLTNTAYGRNLMAKLEEQINYQGNPEVLEGGEYVRSALAYKQAMDSTIYGMKEGATFAQIMRALSKNDKEYFLEFAKEKDPKKRKEILKSISPYKAKVLNELWGEDAIKLQSNEEYFKQKYLPKANWRGWDADTDIESYKIRTIQNEGLLLADFGYYDSELEDIDVRDASPVMFDKEQNMLAMRTNLLAALNGLGLSDVDVSITPSEKPGIQVISDFVSITNYQVKSKINEMFGRRYY